MKKKSFLLIIIAALSVVTFWNISSKSSQRAKADVTTGIHLLSVSFSPATAQINIGDIQTVTVTLTPNTQTDNINAMYVQVNVNNGLQIVDVSKPVLANGGAVAGTEYIKYVQPDYAQLAYDFTTSTQIGSIAPPHAISFNVLVKKLTNVNSSLTIDQTASAIYYGYDPATYYSAEFSWGQVGSFVSTEVTANTPTPIPSPTANPTVILSEVPTSAPVGTCQELSPPQNLSPSGTIYVTAEGQKITWDPVIGAKFYGIEIWEESKTKPTGATGVTYTKISTTSTPDTFYIFTKFVQDKNYLIKVSAIDSCNNAWTPTQATISVAGVAPTAAPTQVPFPSATPTQSIPSVTIKMRLRLQGIYSKPTRSPKSPQIFLVWVRNSDRENPIYKWVTAKYDQTGSWFIEDTWNLVPGDGYKVWIKGEKHLQRKICDGKPSDQESGFYHCANENGNIVIRPGDNYLDFSNVIMFAGDIPFKGESDGVLDAFDLAYVATHFGDTTNDIGDLNFDGVTDSQDYGISVNAIRIQKYDETYPYKIHPFFRNVPLHEAFP